MKLSGKNTKMDQTSMHIHNAYNAFKFGNFSILETKYSMW